MEIDQEELSQRTYALAKENNKLLKKIRRGSFISGIFKLLFWIVMLGIPLWTYFTFLQPILEQGVSTYNQVQGLVGQAQNVTNQAGAQVEGVQGILDAVPGLDILKKFTQ